VTSGWPDSPPATWWDRLWQRFWMLPMLIAAASLALGLILPAVDASTNGASEWVFQGGVDGARSILGTIAGAMISVTGVVFSITMVVLQLASSQFSPRVMRSFIRDRLSQVVIGLLIATFMFCVVTIRHVDDDPAAPAPRVSLTVAVALTVTTVLLIVAHLDHFSRGLQAGEVVRSILGESEHVIEQIRVIGDAQRARHVEAPV